MRQVVGELWDHYNKGSWICITTCNDLMADGSLVMGKGCAREARERFPGLPKFLGDKVKKFGNIPFVANDLRIISFPTKRSFKDRSHIDLIIQSARRVVDIVTAMDIKEIVIPRPGCGLGELFWNDVVKELEPIFTDDRFVIIRRKFEQRQMRG